MNPSHLKSRPVVVMMAALAPPAFWGATNKTLYRALLVSCLLITPALSHQPSPNLNPETSVGVRNSEPLVLSDALNMALHNAPWLAGKPQQLKKRKRVSQTIIFFAPNTEVVDHLHVLEGLFSNHPKTLSPLAQ